MSEEQGKVHDAMKCTYKDCGCFRVGWGEAVLGTRDRLVNELLERCRRDKVDPHSAACRCDTCYVLREIEAVLERGFPWTVAGRQSRRFSSRYKPEGPAMPAHCHGPDCGKLFYVYRRGTGKWCSARCRMRAYRRARAVPDG